MTNVFVQRCVLTLFTVVSDGPADQSRSEKQKSRMNKRKAAADTLQNLRDELHAGGFDGSLLLAFT
jgi:hypothetical protein